MKLKTITLGAVLWMALHAPMVAAGRFTSSLTAPLANGSVQTSSINLTPENTKEWRDPDAMVDAQEQARLTNTSIRTVSQYVGFNLSDSVDNAKVAALKVAFKDALNTATVAMISLESGGPDAYPSAPSFPKYFDPKDYRAVLRVLSNMIEPISSGTGAEVLGLIFWRKEDFYIDNDGNGDWCGRNPGQVAYTVNRQTDEGYRYAIMHMCDKGYDYPALSDCPSICAMIDGTVGHSMSIMATILIHEWTHFHRIGLAALDGYAGLSGLDAHIRDMKNAYESWHCAHLSKKKALINADSYRWFAAETLFFGTCGSRPFKDAPDPNPKPIGPFDDGTNEAPDGCARPMRHLLGERR